MNWWVFSARIIEFVGFARELGVFSVRIVDFGGSARVLVLFSARIASAVDFAREMRCFPACPQEMSPPAPHKIPCTQKKCPRLPQRKRKKKNRSLISEAAIRLFVTHQGNFRVI